MARYLAPSAALLLLLCALTQAQDVQHVGLIVRGSVGAAVRRRVRTAAQLVLQEGMQRHVGEAWTWSWSGDCDNSTDVCIAVHMEPRSHAFISEATHLAADVHAITAASTHSEGFVMQSSPQLVRIVARSPLAVTMAFGRLLRAWTVHIKEVQAQDLSATSQQRLHLSATSQQSHRRQQQLSTTLPPLQVVHAPPPWFHVRGHQFTDYGFAFTPWPAAGKAYVVDLVAFGTNQVELAHIDWARGDLEKMVTYSSIARDLSINISAWYPINMYTANKAAAEATERMFASMPRFNSLFVPGGDGGEVLAPAAFIKAVEGLAAVMRQYHPGASVWVSAQDYSLANLTAFMTAIGQPGVSKWLTGIVYGPHVHVPLTQFLDMAPDGTRVRQYPDLCHMTQSQFEAPRWDPAFTLTYGRLAVAPSAARFFDIITLRTNATYLAHSRPGGRGGHLIGFGAYSEGTSDDLNKVVWSAVASDPDIGLVGAVAAYTAYFFHPAAAPLMQAALFGLERTWRGPLASPTAAASVSNNLRLLNAAYAATPSDLRPTNWRLHMYMLRGYYDAAVHTRLVWQQGTMAAVRAALAGAFDVAQPSMHAHGTEERDTHAFDTLLSLSTPADAIAAALRVIAQRTAALQVDAAFVKLNAGIHTLFHTINSTITAFVVTDQVPDMSMSTLNATISDVPYWAAQLGKAAALPSASEQQAAIDALLAMGTAPLGGFYDRLGSVDAAEHPHLVVGQSAQADPSFYYTSLQCADTNTDALPASAMPPMAHRTYSLSFFDAALTLRYTHLPVQNLTAYNVTVLMWAPLKSSGKAPQTVRLVANGRTIRPYAPAPQPMAYDSWTVPIADVVAHNNTLTLSCNQPPGLSGSGRTCFLSEVIVAPISS